MAIHFTADTHFGHENVIAMDGRPFGSAEEMDEELVRRWNETVRKGDIVHHLGDFAMSGKPEYLSSIAERLNGKIRLVFGNHDSGLRRAMRNGRLTAKAAVKFEDARDYREVRHDHMKFLMSHYPMPCHNGRASHEEPRERDDLHAARPRPCDTGARHDTQLGYLPETGHADRQRRVHALGLQADKPGAGGVGVQDGARMREHRRMRPQMGHGRRGVRRVRVRLVPARSRQVRMHEGLPADRRHASPPRFVRAVKRGFRPQPGRETIGAGAGEPSLRASIGLSLLGHAACPRPS